jgi:hypothetical protein
MQNNFSRFCLLATNNEVPDILFLFFFMMGYKFGKDEGVGNVEEKRVRKGRKLGGGKEREGYRKMDVMLSWNCCSMDLIFIILRF